MMPFSPMEPALEVHNWAVGLQFVNCDNHITVLAQVIEFVRGFVIYRFHDTMDIETGD